MHPHVLVPAIKQHPRSAQPRPPCPACTHPGWVIVHVCAGYLQLDLVDATGLSTAPIAKCLASVKVNLATDCAVSLTPLSSGGSYVASIWADAAGVDTYTDLRECPVTTGATVAGAAVAADRVAAIKTAFANFVYGSARPIAVSQLVFSAAGVVTVTIGTTPLTYAITKVGWCGHLQLAHAIAAGVCCCLPCLPCRAAPSLLLAAQPYSHSLPSEGLCCPHPDGCSPPSLLPTWMPMLGQLLLQAWPTPRRRPPMSPLPAARAATASWWATSRSALSAPPARSATKATAAPLAMAAPPPLSAPPPAPAARRAPTRRAVSGQAIGALRHASKHACH